MDCYTGSRLRFKRDGRKQPLGYLLGRGDNVEPGKSLFIPGHYEVACGGCDTLDGYDTIYGLVRTAHAAGHDVLYEGLLISGESARPIALHNEGYPIQVIALNTPIDVCIDSINARRQAKKGPDAPPVKERNTIAKARAVEIAMEKMKEAGIPCQWASRDDALILIRNALRV
jgi:hypothetical protein